MTNGMIDGQLESLYEAWLVKTRNPVAAASLTAAQLQSNSAVPSAILNSNEAAEFMTVKQAAKKYNLGERTVYRMVEQGLPVSRAGRTVRIKPRDLDRWLAESETILH